MDLNTFHTRLLTLEKQEGTWLLDLPKLRMVFPEEGEEVLKMSIKRRLRDGSLIRVAPGRNRKDFGKMKGARAEQSTPTPKMAEPSTQGGGSMRLPGLYARPRATPWPADALGTLINHARPFDLTYLSLEYRLGEIGVISQMTPVATFMTTGTGGYYETCIGTIELVHTKRSPEALRQELAFDEGRGIYLASPELAYRDLRYTKRNLGLVDLDELSELIEESACHDFSF